MIDLNEWKEKVKKFIQDNKPEAIFLSVILIFLIIFIIPSLRYIFKYNVIDVMYKSSPRYLFEAGAKYFEKKYINYAIGSYKRALEIEEEDGINKLELQKIKNNPYQIESLYNLAVLYYQYKKQYKIAFNFFNAYLEIFDMIGRECPKKEEIVKVMNYILSLDDSSKNPKAQELKTKGNECFFKHQYKEALKYYQAALQLDPTYIEVYNNIASTYLSMGDIKEAIKYWEMTVLVKQDEYDIYANLGLSYEKHLKNTEKALEYYKKFLEYAPKNDKRIPEVRKRIAFLKQKLDLEKYKKQETEEE